jgi:hypothetical protein
MNKRTLMRIKKLISMQKNQKPIRLKAKLAFCRKLASIRRGANLSNARTVGAPVESRAVSAASFEVALFAGSGSPEQ